MRVLVIGYIHAPATHPKYRRFCKDVYRDWQCDTVVFIGDIVDHHSISFHARSSFCPSPMDEYKLALEEIKKWQKEFQSAFVTIGNHDKRPERLAESVNIPSFYLKGLQDVWDTPSWRWVNYVIMDDVRYMHGDVGRGGKTPALSYAVNDMVSTVCGHHHSIAGVNWAASQSKRIFGLDVGCGVDADAMQMAYGVRYLRKPILACAVVIDGIPYHEIMPCGKDEKYAK